MMDQSESDRLLADVEAYCQELRPIEDLCYLDHRYNTETIDLARKYDLLGMHVPKEFGGRGSDLLTYMKALARIGREGTTAVVRAGQTFEVLSTNTLDDGFDASPAIVDGEIYLRGKRFLYCIAEN